MSTIQEIEKLKQVVRAYGAKTLQHLLSALLIWLFGVLVFIPMAASTASNVELLCTLIILVSFTAIILKTIAGSKKLIDAFSYIFARKYVVKKGWEYENAVVVSKRIFYSTFATILYLLYFPFLVRIHPAVSGIGLILVVVFVLFLALEAFRASTTAIIKWLKA